MKNKLYNIEAGSFITQKNKIVLSISKQIFLDSEESLSKFTEMEQDKLFLPIEKTEENDISYLLTYQVDFENFRNLKSVKSESPAVRLAISKTIMEQDILNTYDAYVSVYPANIWYHPMHTVKYAYRGHYIPSIKNEPKIIRYKALLLYIIIGYPYGKALNKEYRIDEKKNPFAIQIANAESIEELTRLIADEEDTLLYEDIRIHKKKKSLLTAVLSVSIFLLLITNCITFFSTKNALAVSANAEVKNQLQDTQNELSKLKMDVQIKEVIKNNDFVKAGALMEEKGESKQTIADFMLENNQYNLALNYNTNLLETIIQFLYDTEKTDLIMDLALDNESSEELVKKLSLEQSIVSYNTEKIDAQWAFTEDNHTLLRAALAYMDKGNRQVAKSIADKLESLEYKEEAGYINALFARAESKNLLKGAKKELKAANALPEEDETRQNRIKEAENDISTYTENIEKAETSVNSTYEQMKEAWSNEKKDS